jgi:hypothetical protein
MPYAPKKVEATENIIIIIILLVVQTGPGVHLASHPVGTGCFPRG